MPIIVLSGRAPESSKIRAFDARADDDVTKPFGMGELIARVRVVSRRSLRAAVGQQLLSLGAATIDTKARAAARYGKPVHLPPIEFRIIACLARKLGMVVTHKQLLTEVWGPTQASDTHALRISLKQLREKLEDDPVQPRHLITKTGIGCHLDTDD
jgi:two-component system KDP operon response regulator KdpE